MNAKKTVAFIPVRGGSKSIPGKNIRLLAGKPLVYWTAKAASDCPSIDVVVVSTDDELIAAAVRSLSLPKLKVIGRSAETATDTASTESALLEFARDAGYDRIILIQATSPLLTTADLTGGLDTFDNSDCDSLLSTVLQKRFIWDRVDNSFVTASNYDPMRRPRRQDFQGYLVENGAFYIMTRTGLIKSGNRLHGKIATWEMPADSFVEIDEPEDWIAVEQALKKRGLAETSLKERLQKIKLVLTDVDGVLTDAGMYYSENGDELKKFSTRDGKGFELLHLSAIKIGIITSENTKLVERRAKKLKVEYLFQGARDKIPALNAILEKSGIPLSEIAYLGDDLADLPVLKQVGLSACPADAVSLVQECVHLRLQSRGGEGAFRELADLILANR